jgi:hypothetical protein
MSRSIGIEDSGLRYAFVHILYVYLCNCEYSMFQRNYLHQLTSE